MILCVLGCSPVPHEAVHNTIHCHSRSRFASRRRCAAAVQRPPQVSFSNGYTVIMLPNVTADGYTSVDTIRTRHIHCPNTFKTTENYRNEFYFNIAVGNGSWHIRQAPAPQAIFQRINPHILIKSHNCAYWLWGLCHPAQRQCLIHAGIRCGCTCAAIFLCPPAGRSCTLRAQIAVFQPSYSFLLVKLHIYACTMQV